MKKPRLTESDRLRIEEGLRKRMTVYAIAKELGRPKRTVMREIRLRATVSDKGAPCRVSNRCVHRFDCQKKRICAHCGYDESRLCRFCRNCNVNCGDFVEDICLRLSHPPYVCNGCPQAGKCVLRKRFYLHPAAQDDYRKRLAETRRGANITELFAMIRILLTEMSGDAGGLELFARLFTVILPDNGTEFSAPSRIETDEVGNRLTRIYYCDPNSAFQKAHVERNHKLLRKILPKGIAPFFGRLRGLPDNRSRQTHCFR